MYFVLLGLVMVGLRLAGLAPVAHWSWWVVLSPFAAAAIWWQLADKLGWTKQTAINRMADKQAERRTKAIEALGLDPERDKRARVARAKLAAQAATVTAPAPLGGSASASGVHPRANRDSERNDPRM
jgi:small Trp-rich protein